MSELVVRADRAILVEVTDEFQTSFGALSYKYGGLDLKKIALMPQVRLQIESEFGSLLDEQVDSAIVRKYQQLVDKGLEDSELIRALWSEDFEQKPAKARLTGRAANGRRIDIEIDSSSAHR